MWMSFLILIELFQVSMLGLSSPAGSLSPTLSSSGILYQALIFQIRSLSITVTLAITRFQLRDKVPAFPLDW